MLMQMLTVVVNKMKTMDDGEAMAPVMMTIAVITLTKLIITMMAMMCTMVDLMKNDEDGEGN